jgi:hypothetical protein
MIEVRRIAEDDPVDFEVVVREGAGETRHHVTMSRETCNRLTVGKHTPERCFEVAFRFLLDREPNESILEHFDVTMISRYSPNSIGNSRATSRSADGRTLRYARIRWTTLGYVENVGFQFLSLRQRPQRSTLCGTSGTDGFGS